MRRGPYARYGKRVLDVIGATLLLIVLAPVFLTLAILIKLFDPGPVIFRQIRAGRGGLPFAFYKFRTMPPDTGDVPSDQLGTVRLSWIGRFLRRSNFDELPQLWNILRGDMSFIGPRPPLPAQAELLDLRAANGALTLRPGLTGLAQVNGYDGMPASEKAAFDGRYAASVSLATDLGVVVQTFSYLRRPPPKY